MLYFTLNLTLSEEEFFLSFAGVRRGHDHAMTARCRPDQTADLQHLHMQRWKTVPAKRQQHAVHMPKGICSHARACAQRVLLFAQVEVPQALVGSKMLAYLGDGQEAVVICDEEGEPLMFQPPLRVACKVSVCVCLLPALHHLSPPPSIHAVLWAHGRAARISSGTGTCARSGVRIRANANTSVSRILAFALPPPLACGLYAHILLPSSFT